MNHVSIPLVTASAAVTLAAMQMALMNYVAFGRAKYATGLGDGGHDALLSRIRMHGNLAENAPIFLILLWLVESAGDWKWALPAIAVAFIAVRVAHIVGLSRSSGNSKPRMIGALGTIICVALLIVLLAISVVRQIATA